MTRVLRPEGSTTDRARPSSRLRRWRGHLAYLVFLLAVIEGTLQAYYFLSVGQPLWARAARPIYAPDPNTVFWNKANLSLPHNTKEFRTILYTNRQGLRVSGAREEFDEKKDASRLRILLMGPSFAYGWGVNYEQTFGARLERMLFDARFAGDRAVQVINAGVPSLGPAGNLAWFEHSGRRLQPDLVIQFVYGSMDVTPDVNQNDYDVDPNGYLIRRNRSRFYYATTVAKNFATVFYGWTAWARLSAAKQSDQTREVAGAGRPMQARATFDSAQAEVVAADAYYEHLRSAVAGAGAQLLLVYFPLAYAIHPEDISRWRHLGVLDVDKERAYNQRFCEHLAVRGVECLNITPQLIEEARNGQRLYYWLDIHWTPEGNRAAAKAVVNHLLARSPSQDTRRKVE